MSGYSKNILVKVLVLSVIVFPLFLVGCTGNEKVEGFAIYLTKDDIRPSQMEALSHVEITEKPVISIDDIIYYNSQTHELKLTPEAFERISVLDVPVSGRSFVVCVDKGPVYWGAFWVPYSSFLFEGVTVRKPLGSELPEIITIELGYPSNSFYQGGDPRENETVLQSLEQAGKLTTGLSITDIDKLPLSIKGYELYSWMEEGSWHFTLITGTNRNKFIEEIVSEEDIISEVGWIKIHVVGVSEIKVVLAKLPLDENVFWSAGLMASVGTSSIVMGYPPQSVIDEIEECAAALGLVLTVL
ncbi:MAG: hypothetical protein PHF74_02845 [Dehalococcoidales bacterium]|nr:hypothetical protein [Dehalococcoidales bacterium]